MKLIVGLGNPGNQYKKNRHNVGFLFLDFFLDSTKFKKKKTYEYQKIFDSIFIKPKTYMNRSGAAVTAVLTEYDIKDILIIVDDVNLPIGEIRFRRSGGSGGHNGLKSISSALGNDDFKRLRIGVSAPKNQELSEFVLSNFSKADFSKLSEVFDLCKELLHEYLQNDFDALLNLYSKKKKSYSEITQDLK